MAKMNGADLIDHSPSQPEPCPPISGASRLVLIDNYDSFTWNVYQYLVLEGATVTVYRNDEIDLPSLIAFNPTQLVISPGPGHPDSDAGISKDAIRHFSGKVPVLGVCMGEQCIVSVFGGRVEITGEILHGKTSPLRHDSKGVFAGLSQDLPVTRYHSLAATHPSLPQCLEVSSWIASGTDGKRDVIMGVRHKFLLVEGVQFHPESILTENGRDMLKNFLHMKGGTWEENENNQAQHSTEPYCSNRNVDKGSNSVPNARGGPTSTAVFQNQESILDRIFKHRKSAVEIQKQIPSQRLFDLEASYSSNISPPQISFVRRIRISPYSLSLMAEIKRASPSKGDIAPSICAPAQAKKYALAGASVISVLTEPEWFKGSIDDLRAVRQSLEGMPCRPAILRKEFIFDEYQILEARLAGADTVLLIVKMLSESRLQKLYAYSQSLGMEPLVEVNTIEEMQVATRLGAQVIGVNNRNLANFEVDLDTTSRLMEGVPKDTIVCALSGISGPNDVKAYEKNGVGAVLVGEALMRAEDTGAFVDRLLGSSFSRPEAESLPKVLVKICGTRTPEAAAVAVEAGADMIGVIMVPGRKRCISNEAGLAISKVVHDSHKQLSRAMTEYGSNDLPHASEYFDHGAALLRRSNRALLVGVFQNQPLSYILAQQQSLRLDIIQLHGSEPIEWASLIPVPVIRRFGPGDPGLGRRGYHTLPLLDSAVGGTGQKLDTEGLTGTLKSDKALRVILAGGLSPENVRSVMQALSPFTSQIVALDVSSGVEKDGEQDHQRIEDFIAAARSNAA